MRVYNVLALSPQHLSEGVIRGIHRWAKQHKDVALLTTLASRPDLPQDVLAALAKEPHAKVRVAYLSRPDRTPEELAAAVAKEKRVTVLTAVAESSEASAGLLQALGQVENAKVRRALLENPNTPKPTAKEALQAAWEKDELDPWNSAALLGRRGDLHELASECLSALASKRQGAASFLGNEVLLSTQLSPAAQARIAQTVIAEQVERAAKAPQYGSSYTLDRIITTFLARGVLAPEALEVVKRTVKSPAANVVFTTKQLTAHQRLINERSGAAHEVDEAQQLIDEARTTKDPARAQELGARLSAEIEAERATLEVVAAAEALCRNAAASDETILPLLKAVGRGTLPEILKERKTSREVVVEILDRNIRYLSGGAVEHLEDPRSVVYELAVRASKRGVDRTAWLVLLDSEHLDTEGLRLLPWALTEGLSPWGNQSQRTVKMLSELLDEVLGDDEKRWEVFATLAEGTNASVGELLETAKMLAEGP